MKKILCLFVLGLLCFCGAVSSEEKFSKGINESQFYKMFDPDKDLDNSWAKKERSREVQKPKYSKPEQKTHFETHYVYDPCEDIPDLPMCTDPPPETESPDLTETESPQK